VGIKILVKVVRVEEEYGVARTFERVGGGQP
jgi:hypothetical protein